MKGPCDMCGHLDTLEGVALELDYDEYIGMLDLCPNCISRLKRLQELKIPRQFKLSVRTDEKKE